MFLVVAAVAVPFSYDGTLRSGQTLAIRDVNGSVRVRTGDRLSIRATKRANRGDPNAVAIRVDTRSNGIIVCVRYPPQTNRACDEPGTQENHNNDTSVAFDVTVPRGIVLDASSVNGDVDVVNDGPTEVTTVNGNVRADGRDVQKATTVNGTVTVDVHDRSRGSLVASTVNGSIDVTLPPDTGLSLDAGTVTGDINASGMKVERPRYGPGARASGTLGDGALHLSLHTTNGSITLH
jgi:carbon monoxide dehydrogenase subunit G